MIISKKLDIFILINTNSYRCSTTVHCYMVSYVLSATIKHIKRQKQEFTKLKPNERPLKLQKLRSCEVFMYYQKLTECIMKGIEKSTKNKIESE